MKTTDQTSARLILTKTPPARRPRVRPVLLATFAAGATALLALIGYAAWPGIESGEVMETAARCALQYGSPVLKGSWFLEGFMGTMGELLCAIESKREPVHSARDNLPGLALCIAAVRSAESGRPELIGKARKVNPKTCGI